jgi:hypothetical protein
MVQAGQDKKVTPKNKAKRPGSMVKAVEHLPNKHETQSSNPSITKNKNV